MAGYDAFDDDFFRDCPYGGRASLLPMVLRVPLAVAVATDRALRGLLLLVLRLTLQFGISAALLLLVVFVALGADRDDLAALDPRPYMQAISDVDPGEGQDLLSMQRQMMRLAETDFGPTSEMEDDPSVSGLVEWLLRILPEGQASAYEELTPLLHEYESMLGQTETALSRRTVDAMFADLEPWLEMAEKDAARYEAQYVD